MGNESQLKGAADSIKNSLNGIFKVEVVGVDMEDDREAVFSEAVDRASSILGNLDALVHCYSYEGNLNASSLSICLLLIPTVLRDSIPLPAA